MLKSVDEIMKDYAEIINDIDKERIILSDSDKIKMTATMSISQTTIVVMLGKIAEALERIADGQEKKKSRKAESDSR